MYLILQWHETGYYVIQKQINVKRNLSIKYKRSKHALS